MIRPGDIIGVANDSWLSRSIREATGDGPVSHIQIVTAIEPFVQVTEALNRVVVNELAVRMADSTAVYHMQPLNVTDEQRLHAVRIALSYVGRDYGYGDILLQGMDALARTKFWCDHFAEEQEPICSMLGALSWPDLHLDAKSETPNDFIRLAQNHPEAWTLVQVK